MHMHILQILAVGMNALPFFTAERQVSPRRQVPTKSPLFPSIMAHVIDLVALEEEYELAGKDVTYSNRAVDDWTPMVPTMFAAAAEETPSALVVKSLPPVSMRGLLVETDAPPESMHQCVLSPLKIGSHAADDPTEAVGSPVSVVGMRLDSSEAVNLKKAHTTPTKFTEWTPTRSFELPASFVTA